MKIKMPKISSKVNHQIIMIFILLIVVIFITVMPWASNTFHEALENITTTPDVPTNGSLKDKVKSPITPTTPITLDSTNSAKTPTGDISSMLTNINNMTTGKIPSNDTKTEGFVSGLSFQDSATTFPGAPIDTTNWYPSTNVAQDVATPLDRNNLYMFNNARFSHNCCAKGPGSGMSSSMGCVCLTNDDAFYITQGRGGGNINPTDIF
jgi:hypothetical protein